MKNSVIVHYTRIYFLLNKYIDKLMLDDIKYKILIMFVAFYEPQGL